VFTAPYGMVAYIQQIPFNVYSAVGLIPYIEEIAFIVYSAVRTDCLYRADGVLCLERGTNRFLI